MVSVRAYEVAVGRWLRGRGFSDLVHGLFSFKLCNVRYTKREGAGHFIVRRSIYIYLYTL